MPRRKAASEADQQVPSATPGKADPKKDKAAAKRKSQNLSTLFRNLSVDDLFLGKLGSVHNPCLSN